MVSGALDNEADPPRYIGSVTTDATSTTYLLQFLMRQGSTFAVEDVDGMLLAATSSVFGAVQEGRPWMFAVTDSHLLRVCRRDGGENPWTCQSVEQVPDGVGALQGDGAAAGWRNPDGKPLVSAIVRDDAGAVWEARFGDTLQPEAWIAVGTGAAGNARDTVRAVLWPGGLDAAYVRQGDGPRLVQIWPSRDSRRVPPSSVMAPSWSPTTR
jgi:hypothetical protein